jgi:hypothetical protein
MPSNMTEEELDKALESATRIDEYDYRNEDDEDDYFTASLHKTNDNRYFRLVESSGYNSDFSAAGNIGEWLADDEVADWHDY